MQANFLNFISLQSIPQQIVKKFLHMPLAKKWI